MIITVKPSSNGHYDHYEELLKLHSNEGLISSVLTGSFSSTIQLLALIWHNKPTKVVFLFGERFWLHLILIRFIFPHRKVSGIFYYSLYPLNRLYKVRLLSFFVLRVFMIEVFYLEYDHLDLKQFTKAILGIRCLKDPVIASYGTSPCSEPYSNNNLTFLIAGFIDSRKCVPNVVSALNKYCLRYPNKKVSLLLLGEQTADVSSFLDALDDSSLSFDIEAENRRFSDEELVSAIQRSVLVFAVYKDHYGSSGIVLTSIYHRTPVVFVSTGILSSWANELDLSFLPASESENDILEYLNSFIDMDFPHIEKRRSDLFLESRFPVDFCRNILN